ncbi:MAG: ubiquinone/menaquinone biosynthesis methyltransferase [Planctomycetes bacterium]|nr:ubiquinone/menaquinone biosynthesis methyltransferase [Planctomycetota bacterium]
MNDSDGSTLAGSEKEAYVTGMFNRIARPYDRLNRLISLGRDVDWRRLSLDWAGLRADEAVVDLGCGTGDFFLEIRRRVGPGGRVIGIDVAENMLSVAREKAARDDGGAPADLRLGSAEATGLPDGCADLVTMGWVLRNVGDRSATYREILRILKPGGRYLSIDMSRPGFAPARWASSAYLALAMPVMIRLAGGDREAYRYLDQSTRRFPDRRALEIEWREAGFATVASRSFMMGTIGAVLGVKP